MRLRVSTRPRAGDGGDGGRSSWLRAFRRGRKGQLVAAAGAVTLFLLGFGYIDLSRPDQLLALIALVAFVWVPVALPGFLAGLRRPFVWRRPTIAREDENGSGDVYVYESGKVGEIDERYTRSQLCESFVLRVALRERFGLTLDLGDDSPEVLHPGDPPIAEWQPISALPESVDGVRGSSVYRTNAAGPGLLRESFDERAASFLRKTATFAATVVDEAALDAERLYVREDKDFGSMDLSLLRGAAPLGDGSVSFSFGKFTTVVFPDASASRIVAALRERIPWNTIAPAPIEAAEDEVAALPEQLARRDDASSKV